MVDTVDLKSAAERHIGSTPISGTIFKGLTMTTDQYLGIISAIFTCSLMSEGWRIFILLLIGVVFLVRIFVMGDTGG